MLPGKSYTVTTNGLVKGDARHRITFDVSRARSEAVHVNTIGYVPNAPAKYAYVYHWMGDAGSLDLKTYANKPFYLADVKTGEHVFAGELRFRLAKENPETTRKTDSPPNGNFLNTDVWECDFSAFRKPGTFVIAVEGVGSSFPFRLGADVYHPAFRTVARGLYHNRSGIALTKPYTGFERPTPHNPNLMPGFAGKFRYTRVRWQEWGSEGGTRRN